MLEADMKILHMYLEVAAIRLKLAANLVEIWGSSSKANVEIAGYLNGSISEIMLAKDKLSEN